MLTTILSLISAILLLVLIIKLTIFQRSMPNIDEVLNDVGISIGDQLKQIFENPTVKKAYSILGKQSGEVRADAALRNKAADKLLEGYPSIGFILDQLDLTPVEGLQLLKDPLIGPFIQGALQKGLKGLQNPSSSRAEGVM